jgi:SAM-dependent methyltransferase
VDRRAKLLAHVDVAGGRGLEIGPLINPTVTRDAANIFYLDHASTEELRAKYADDPAIDASKITSVDFVWGAQSMLEATKSQAPFDYVIASHVLEHVPDFAGWLGEVESVLSAGGRLSIAVPDRRYTFDVRRRPSDISEVVEASLLGFRRPSVRATFDHFYRFAEVDTGQMWQGAPGHNDPPFEMSTALSLARVAAESSDYVDTHCWVFSPSELLELLRHATALDLFGLQLIAFSPTEFGQFEFFATFEKLSDDISLEERRVRCLDGLDRAIASQPAPTPVDSAKPGAIEIHVSPRERQLLQAKRAILRRAREAVAAVRRHTR